MKKSIVFVVIAIIVGAVLVLRFDKFESNESKKNNLEEEVVTIGYFGPLSGPVSSTGISAKNGFELAFKELNDQNGLYDIRVIYEDSMCDPKKAVSVAKKFLTIDRVDYVVSGVCSGSTLAVAPLAQEHKKILIGSVPTSPDITHAGEYVFRVSSSSVRLARETARKLMSKNITSISILVEQVPYTIGWQRAIEKEFGNLGGEVVAVEIFSSNEKDLISPLAKLNGKKADAILALALSPPSAASVLKSYRELGIDKTLVGNEVFGFAPSIDNSNGGVDGMYVVTYGIEMQSEKTSSLKERYNETFSKSWSSAYLATLGYDTFALLNEGIRKCGRDSGCMKDFLYSVKDYDGMTGTFSIDENGDGVHNFVLKRMLNGKLE